MNKKCSSKVSIITMSSLIMVVGTLGGCAANDTQLQKTKEKQDEEKKEQTANSSFHTGSSAGYNGTVGKMARNSVSSTKKQTRPTKSPSYTSTTRATGPVRASGNVSRGGYGWSGLFSGG